MLIEIFCCYARKDQSLLNELKTHLIPLQRRGLVNVWNDTDISPGKEREEEIKRHLDTAQIILLLVSPDFIASDYCYSNLMYQAMERHERREARVIPIVLKHAIWHETPFGKLEALPIGAKPVTGSSWRNRNVAFHNVAEGVRKTVEEMNLELSGITKTIPDPLIPAFGMISTSSINVRTPIPTTSHKGNANQVTKHYAEMLAAYNQAIRLDPTDAYPYTFKGDALYDLERYEEALTAYEQASQLDPDNPYIYIFLGHTFSELERYEEALTAYEKASRDIPDDAFVQGCKSIVLYDQERYEEALAACERSIQVDPNDRFTQYHKGLILSALGCPEEALDAFEHSLQLDPSDDFVYQLKGDALYDLERYEEALVAYDQAIRLNPNSASAYKGKADALFELRQFKEAITAYNRAIRLDPNDAKAYVGKGNALKQILEVQKKNKKAAKKSRTSAGADRRHE